MSRLSRRAFVSGGVAAGAALGTGLLMSGDGDEPTTDAGRFAGPPATPRAGNGVLVVVQCNGGNDGLNTLVPLDGTYHDMRDDLAISDNDLVALDGVNAYGMHPSLAPLAGLWASGRMRWHVNVGFENPDRSHFEAMDTWAAGSTDGTYRAGWLGRWLDDQQDENPLLAVSLGGASRSLFGEVVRPTVVTNPSSFGFTDIRGSSAVIDALSGLDPASARHPLAEAAREGFADAHAAVDMFSTFGGDERRQRPTVGALLGTAAQLIDQDLGTRVIAVMTSGFDTHANQAPTHARLLGELGEGVAEFYASLDQLGLADRVQLAVTSEFGRRAEVNGSGGTDHGKAGTLFTCGAGVEQGIDGEYALSNLLNGDLRPVIKTEDFLAAAGAVLG